MALNADTLAEKINKAISARDKNDDKISVPSELLQYAKALVETLKEGTFSHSSGTVTGTAPPQPGSVPDLKAVNGTLTSLSKSLWAQTAGEGIDDPQYLSKEAQASIKYLQDNAVIEFSSGMLTGQSSAAIASGSPVPGTLTGGGKGGTLSGLKGTDWAKAVAPDKAHMPLADKIFNTIVKYLEENIELSYPQGSVTGSFGGGGMPLTAGLGAEGEIK